MSTDVDPAPHDAGAQESVAVNNTAFAKEGAPSDSVAGIQSAQLIAVSDSPFSSAYSGQDCRFRSGDPKMIEFSPPHLDEGVQPE